MTAVSNRNPLRAQVAITERSLASSRLSPIRLRPPYEIADLVKQIVRCAEVSDRCRTSARQDSSVVSQHVLFSGPRMPALFA
jgi:hypothetical protein